MNLDKKFVRKTFFVHQYEEEEKFLMEMAEKGWKFVKIHRGLPTKYEFIKAEPEEVLYQLDFIGTDEDTEDYHQLFLDAGWTQVFDWDGIDGTWYYFAKNCNGKEERIYTDTDSKIQMYNRIQRRFLPFFLIIIALEVNAVKGIFFLPEIHKVWLLAVNWVFGGFCSVCLILYVFLTYGLLKKKRQLVKMKEENL